MNDYIYRTLTDGV